MLRVSAPIVSATNKPHSSNLQRPHRSINCLAWLQGFRHIARHGFVPATDPYSVVCAPRGPYALDPLVINGHLLCLLGLAESGTPSAWELSSVANPKTSSGRAVFSSTAIPRKGASHLSMTMSYASFIAAAWKVYQVPEDWNYGLPRSLSSDTSSAQRSALISLQIWTSISIHELPRRLRVVSLFLFSSPTAQS